MGHFGSKIFPFQEETDGKVDLPSQIGLGSLEKHQCTPIMSKKRLMNDPRSASSGITRTPIEVTSPSAGGNRIASAVPKRLQVKKYLETDVDSVMTSLVCEDPRSPTNCCQRTPITVKTSNCEPNLKLNIGTPQPSMSNWDPRSPATDFDRTPILKLKSGERVDANKGEESPTSQLYCELSTEYNIPEIQVLPEINGKSGASKFEKRLEECNQLDDSVDNSALITASNTDESDFDDQVTVIPNIKALQEQNVVKNDEELSEKAKTTLQIHDSLIEKSSNQFNIWKDSSPQLAEELRSSETLLKSEEIIIEFDDELPIIKPMKMEVVGLKLDKNKVTENKKKTQPIKRDSKLIYEDSTESSLISDANINRLPFTNKSNRHQLTFPIQSPQILRTKTVSMCKENTPPHPKRSNKSKAKANSTQWDHDRTVVI